jgi:hypothetical protein|nr:MAG TPA: hypothetical protein [Caudoviricetes sp.]
MNYIVTNKDGAELYCFLSTNEQENPYTAFMWCNKEPTEEDLREYLTLHAGEELADILLQNEYKLFQVSANELEQHEEYYVLRGKGVELPTEDLWYEGRIFLYREQNALHYHSEERVREAARKVLAQPKKLAELSSLIIEKRNTRTNTTEIIEIIEITPPTVKKRYSPEERTHDQIKLGMEYKGQRAYFIVIACPACHTKRFVGYKVER